MVTTNTGFTVGYVYEAQAIGAVVRAGLSTLPAAFEIQVSDLDVVCSLLFS